MKNPRILLIEDNPIHARLIKGLLAQVDGPPFSIELATSLAAGIDLFSKGAFDLILLDLVLPDSQEMATYNQVRKIAPKTPIVILTNLDDIGLATQAVAAGAQKYLIKTATKSPELAEAIKSALSQGEASG